VPKIIPLVVACAALAFAATSTLAQGDEANLFISPCGEPFTAPHSDPYPIVKWFKQADANGDGKLDIDEMRADATRFFKVLDRNGDGYIDSLEVAFYEYRMVPQILHPAALETGIVRVLMQRGVDSIDPGGASPGQENVYKDHLDPNQGAVPFSLFHEPEPVRSADRNFDYRITLKEFQDHSDRHFHTLDVNNKGFLTLADLPKTAVEKDVKAHR